MPLKNLLLYLLLLVFVPSSLQAQQENFFQADENRTFFGGLTAGANFTEVYGDGYHGFHKAGFTGGAIVYGRFLKDFLASVEMTYIQKGSRGVRENYSYYSGPYFERYFLDLNYVEVPVVLHYIVSRRWHIGAGGAYARLLNYKESVATDQPVYIDPNLFPFQKDDISYILNATWQGYNNWLVGLRFQRSLRPIRDAYYVPLNLGSGDQTNVLFQVKVIYLFK